MSDTGAMENCIVEALDAVENFIAETTGKKPTQPEIANALTRYFVLNEIKAHIVMEREQTV